MTLHLFLFWLNPKNHIRVFKLAAQLRKSPLLGDNPQPHDINWYE